MNDSDSEISKGQCISLPSVLSFLHAANTEQPHAIIFLFKNEIFFYLKNLITYLF